MIRGGTAAIAVLLGLFALNAASLQAQVQDTLRADTLGADSLVAEQDTLLPPPTMVEWPGREASGDGLADGRWVWDRDALLREGAISLLDLLQRVPGIVTFRSGVALQPEAASAFGGGADRTQIIWDGYALDPLGSSSLDLSLVQLSHIERVVVERRPDALVIRIDSDAPSEARAYSRIEAGVGEPEANLFSGMLLTPNFLFGPFGVAVDRLELRGSGRPQPADAFSGWLRWGWLGERRGIELTLTSRNLTREPESPVPADISRQDLVVRGRTRIGQNGAAEAYLGRATYEYEETDTSLPDSLRFRQDLSAMQAGARMAWTTDVVSAEGALRWRDEPRLPYLDAELSAAVRPRDWLAIEGGIITQKWDDGLGATSYRASASVRPLPWLRAFGGFADGRRASPGQVDSIETPNKGTRQVLRGGAELSFGRLTAAAAGVRMTADSVPLFDLPGDTLDLTAAGAATLNGWEASATVPLVGDWLFFDGAWSAWISGARSTYVPQSIGRATLRIHTSPLESGNFELYARLDARQRGALVGLPAEPGGVPVQAPSRTLIDGYLQIRIIDVRIWLRFDDIAGNEIQDLPGLFVQGPRVFYGVKWSFWN